MNVVYYIDLIVIYTSLQGYGTKFGTVIRHWEPERKDFRGRHPHSVLFGLQGFGVLGLLSH